jgi:hypothetical protein
VAAFALGDARAEAVAGRCAADEDGHSVDATDARAAMGEGVDREFDFLPALERHDSP